LSAVQLKVYAITPASGASLLSLASPFPSVGEANSLFPLLTDHSVVCFTHSDLAAIDTQITTDGSLLIDLEILRKGEGEDSFATVQLPKIL